MPDIIKDGKGKGYLVQVTKDNQIVSRATSLSGVHSASVKGDTYFIPILFKQAVGATEELAGYIMYTGVRTCIFQLVILSSQEASLTQATIYAGTTFASGGYSSAAANLNTSSSKTFPGTIKIQADGAVPFVSPVLGTHLFQANLIGGGMYSLDTLDSMIVRPNLPLGVTVKCTNANSLVRIYVTVYETDLDS